MLDLTNLPESLVVFTVRRTLAPNYVHLEKYLTREVAESKAGGEPAEIRTLTEPWAIAHMLGRWIEPGDERLELLVQERLELLAHLFG